MIEVDPPGEFADERPTADQHAELRHAVQAVVYRTLGRNLRATKLIDDLVREVERIRPR